MPLTGVSSPVLVYQIFPDRFAIGRGLASSGMSNQRILWGSGGIIFIFFPMTIFIAYFDAVDIDIKKTWWTVGLAALVFGGIGYFLYRIIVRSEDRKKGKSAGKNS